MWLFQTCFLSWFTFTRIMHVGTFTIPNNLRVSLAKHDKGVVISDGTTDHNICVTVMI